ncbi:gas vesicle accessory protein GvpU [Paenibacillus xylanexedens]|uniref:gas vesicle accessory protein GvpU n=1 Tax=Paenibacillus xylanexedens TaxID=528191 RepID=UPI0011A12B73|nr:gas vesicle accessory protein GvpU [Paenibacillus xylanexedens]
MSEVNEATTEATSSHNDVTLEALVRVANIGLSIGVTLSVGGALVSGILASGKEYMESVADLFEGVNEQGEHLASIYRRFAEGVYSEAIPDDANIEFIHLKDATIYHGTTDFNISLWRGKLSAVDGFSFGTLKK